MFAIRDVVVDPVLSDLSVKYSNESYVSEVLMPVFPVKKQQGTYYVYDKADFRRNATRRAPGSQSNETEYGLTTATFYAEDHALKEKVPFEVIDQADSALSPEMDATESVTDQLMIDKEIALATTMVDTAVITQYKTLSGTSQWSDYSNSDPIADIRLAIKTVQKGIGRRPNTLVLSQPVFDKLIDHPDIVDRIKYTITGGAVGAPELARVFSLKNVVIAGALYNTAKEGQTDALDFIWGNNAWVCYINEGSRLKAPTFGYTFSYQTREVKKWDDLDAEARYIRVHDNYVQKVVAATAVYALLAAIA
jgi:hypothetical protein